MAVTIFNLKENSIDIFRNELTELISNGHDLLQDIKNGKTTIYDNTPIENNSEYSILRTISHDGKIYEDNYIIIYK